MRNGEYYYPLKILNLLMRNQGRWFSTEELCSLLECSRKTVYASITGLEINGFGIDVKKGHIEEDRIVNSQMHYYKFNGVYGI